MHDIPHNMTSGMYDKTWPCAARGRRSINAAAGTMVMETTSRRCFDVLEDYRPLLAPLSSRLLAGDGDKPVTTSRGPTPCQPKSASDRDNCRVARPVIGGKTQYSIGLPSLCPKSVIDRGPCTPWTATHHFTIEAAFRRCRQNVPVFCPWSLRCRWSIEAAKGKKARSPSVLSPWRPMLAIGRGSCRLRATARLFVI